MPRGMDSEGQKRIGRRTYLKGAGLAALAGLAGCSGGGDGGSGDGSSSDGSSGDGSSDGGSDGSSDGESSSDGGSAGESGDSGPIPVGNLSPFSGGLGWIGPNSRRGVQTALEAEGGVNATGVLGTTVEISEQDSETKPQPAISGFNTLDSEGVMTMVGPSSSVTPSLIEPARSAKLSFVSPMTGTIQLDNVGGKYIWRTVPSDGIGARAQAQYAYNELGAESMALAYKNDRGSQSFSAASGDYFSTLGGSVKEEVPLDPAASDYRSEVQALQDADVDVVSMTAATEVSGLFIQNYVEAGADEDFELLLGNDVLTPDFIEEMGADVMEGMVGQAPAPGPANDVFVERHQAQHDKEPGAFAAAAYDAMNLIGLAFVKEGEANRQAVPKHLSELGNPPGKKVSTFAQGKKALENGEEINYHGAANPQNFNDKGDPLGPFSALQAQDGEWVEVKTYSAQDLATE
ncbi:ABC transporter substrate-binding protein [Halomicroarcula sp. GCM10025817]|uniref:ABC transporter substrate-binding protein n=1 Tax=Haloarcula TaxID=2237 RepID=UPI0023E7F7CA|nr:ABC transporter substrate-binding protein [Halomicroarcula sp. SYNS111]